MKRSRFLNIDFADLGKGLLIAFLTALLGGILELLQAGEIPTTWAVFQPILELSLAAGVSYLLKNLFTNSEGQIMRGEESAARLRASKGGSALKMILAMALLFPIAAAASAQGFIKDVTPDRIAKKQAIRERSTDTLIYNGQHAWFFRGGATITYKKLFYSKTAGKIIAEDYNRPGIGLEFAKYEVFEGTAISDIGVGAYFMIPVKDVQNYASALASVQIYDLARKLKLEFLPPGLSIGGGISYDFNTEVPTIERLGFVPSISIKF